MPHDVDICSRRIQTPVRRYLAETDCESGEWAETKKTRRSGFFAIPVIPYFMEISRIRYSPVIVRIPG